MVGAFQYARTRQTTLIVCLTLSAAALIQDAALAAPRATDKEIIDSPLYKPAPEYPERALNAGVEGSVRLSVTVAPDGRVIEAKVIEAYPKGWFEKAALDAIKKWKYRAPRIELTFEIVIDFEMPLPER